MSNEEALRRISTALDQLSHTERQWGKIEIIVERGEPRHVNVTMEVKEEQ